MKILLYSSVFYPSTGGIEIVSETLATNLIKLGHECVVITETPEDGNNKQFIFTVIRQPSFATRLAWVRWADVVHSKGASMALFFYAKLLLKPFIWTHGGYQLLCLDGLGWVDGEEAPLSPGSSARYHLRKSGWVYVLKNFPKLMLRRWCGHLADLNVAITHWVAHRQPLPRQVVIYNPFPLQNFKQAPPSNAPQYAFIYVGRLVSEKGVGTLLSAFAELLKEQNFTELRLLIVGDGNWRPVLEKVSANLKIAHAVHFAGSHRGSQLLDHISNANIAVVPSQWEEPMGGVALELLAARKNIIVSQKGGLAECIGPAGLTFPNGDYLALADCMKKLVLDHTLQEEHKKAAELQVTKFDEIELTRQYILAYERVRRPK